MSGRRFVFEVVDRGIRRGVAAVAGNANALPANHLDVALIADHLVAGAVVDVLLVTPEPQACRAAITAVLNGRARAALAAPDELAALESVVAAIDQGVRVVGSAVIDCAARLPPLSDRQIALLMAMASGATNAILAEQLDTSTSSIKREIAQVAAIVGVTSRRALQEFGRGFLLR